LKRLFSLILITAISVLFSAWGSAGHRLINNNASLSFNQQMEAFHTWTEFLSDHASDADYRKDEDPDEGPKHYIDIDNYYSFMFLGRIPQTFDSVLSMYGSSFVYSNGILPWATENTVSALQKAFEDRDFETAQQLAADLGHYVADGHMPLHITANYNGQLTGNDGIHSRYESSMINAYIDQIQYSGDSISYIENVNQYIFGYIYSNYTYVDSVLMADDYAQSVAGSTSSSAYKQALWEKTGSFTTGLMKKASHSLTELIYTAWVNAGSPPIDASGKEENDLYSKRIIQQLRYSDPGYIPSLTYRIRESGRVRIVVYDLRGVIVATLTDEFALPGDYEVSWTNTLSPAGMYVVSVQTPSSMETARLIRLP